MSDSEIKEFGLARLKEDDAGLGSIVLVTKLPSDAAMLASIDLGSIERLRTLRVSLEKLEAWPGEVVKEGWITDLERRCREKYGELYTAGTDLEYKGLGGTEAWRDADINENYKDALGRAWEEGVPIRLISDGMVNSEVKPGYIGFVKTKNPVPGYLWDSTERFMDLPPESLKVVSSQESQESPELPELQESPELPELQESQAYPGSITFGQAGALQEEWMRPADPGLNAPLIPKGGGRKRKRKTKRRKTKRKTKQKGTKKRGTKRR
jgi:hypothetical protein